MYADDITLFCTSYKLNRKHGNIVISEHLDKVNSWMKSNKLVVNFKKATLHVFHNHNNVVHTLELILNDSNIEQVSTFN